MAGCPACGHEIVESANFCPNCGASVVRVSGDTTRVIQPVQDEIAVDDLLEDGEPLPEGSAMLVTVRGNQAGARFLIDADVTTAGRHPRSDIFLDDVTVSRHHARFTRRDGFVWVNDEGSLNGTYVNQELIDGEVALRNGDTVQIGKFRMVFLDGHPGPG